MAKLITLHRAVKERSGEPVVINTAYFAGCWAASKDFPTNSLPDEYTIVSIHGYLIGVLETTEEIVRLIDHYSKRNNHGN